MDFSPDGKSLASASGEDSDEDLEEQQKKKIEKDNTVRIWDLELLKERYCCRGHSTGVKSVRFSPNGKAFVSMDIDDALILWDTSTGERRKSLDGGYNLATTFGFTPDGASLLTWQRGGRIHQCTIPNGEEQRVWEEGRAWIKDFQFSADGKTLLTVGDRIQLWDVAAGKELQLYEGHGRAIQSLTCSPDGRFLASQDYDKWLHMWETGTGRCLSLEGWRPHRVYRLAFVDNQTFAAVGDDLRLRVWEIPSGRKVRDIALGNTTTATYWEENSHLANEDLFSDEPANSWVVFSPDRKLLAFVRENEDIQFWDVGRGVKVARLKARQGWMTHLLFAPDGKHLAALGCDRVIRLWELPSGREVRQFPGEGEHEGHLAFSPDNKLLAWSWDGKIRLWDLAERRETGGTFSHPDKIHCLTFVRDHHTLVSSNGRTTWVWDTATGQVLRKVITSKYTHAASIGPPGSGFLYLCSHRKCPECSLREGRTMRDIVSQEGRRIERWAISPDGKTVAVMVDPVTYPMETISLREIATSKVLGSLTGGHLTETMDPSFFVESPVLAFSPDGHCLASGGIEGTILIWDWRRGCGLTAR